MTNPLQRHFNFHPKQGQCLEVVAYGGGHSNEYARTSSTSTNSGPTSSSRSIRTAYLAVPSKVAITMLILKGWSSITRIPSCVPLSTAGNASSSCGIHGETQNGLESRLIAPKNGRRSGSPHYLLCVTHSATTASLS